MITFLATDRRLLIDALDEAIHSREQAIRDSGNKQYIEKLRREIGYMMTTQKHIIGNNHLVACN